MEEQNNRERFYLIDNIRGIMIIGVVLFHFIFDLYYVGVPIGEAIITSPIFDIVATVGRVLFVLIAGICSRLSRNNLKRSLFVLVGAGIVQLATLLIDLLYYKELGNMYIYFGILHLLGCCMLIYGLVELPFKHKAAKESSRASRIASLIIAGLLFVGFIATFSLDKGKIGLFNTYEVNFSSSSVLGAIMGLPGDSLASADYFPLIPWAFMFFCGVLLGVYFKEDRVPKLLHSNPCPPLAFIGRKTLYIYLLHQPLVYGIALLISGIAVNSL